MPPLAKVRVRRTGFNPPMTTQLDHAKRYVRRGTGGPAAPRPVRTGRRLAWPRDCASPSKASRRQPGCKGLRDATKDPAVIDEWFGRGRFNIGIATGAISGIIALDVDPRHDGDQTFAGLEGSMVRCRDVAVPHRWRWRAHPVPASGQHHSK